MSDKSAFLLADAAWWARYYFFRRNRAGHYRRQARKALKRLAHLKEIVP